MAPNRRAAQSTGLGLGATLQIIKGEVIEACRVGKSAPPRRPAANGAPTPDLSIHHNHHFLDEAEYHLPSGGLGGKPGLKHQDVHNRKLQSVSSEQCSSL